MNTEGAASAVAGEAHLTEKSEADGFKIGFEDHAHSFMDFGLSLTFKMAASMALKTRFIAK